MNAEMPWVGLFGLGRVEQTLADLWLHALVQGEGREGGKGGGQGVATKMPLSAGAERRVRGCGRGKQGAEESEGWRGEDVVRAVQSLVRERPALAHGARHLVPKVELMTRPCSPQTQMSLSLSLSLSLKFLSRLSSILFHLDFCREPLVKGKAQYI